MIKICSVAFLSLLLSASSLFAQTKTFAGADYSQGIVFVMENNQMVWKHKAPDSNDLWILPNGNILFTTGHGVLEMTRQNDTIFHYESKSPVFACQRLKNGNTFVGECVTGRMLEISPKGKIVKETCILPKGVKDGGFAFMRNARRLDNGHFLVAHYGDQCVKEYDANGKVVWKLDVPGGPHSLTRLPNGHTLIAVADKECGYSRKAFEVSRRFSVLLRRTFPDYELDGTCESEGESTSAAGRPPEECALLSGKYSGTTDDVFRI